MSDEIDDAWGDALNEQAETEVDNKGLDKLKEDLSGGGSKADPPSSGDGGGEQNVLKIQNGDIEDNAIPGDETLNKLRIQNIDFILDVPLKVSVELGRTSVLIKDLLNLGQGSVLELDKMAGEPLEVLVNGNLIARGEVVVVNEKFGIRITDIISPVERIETLRH